MADENNKESERLTELKEWLKKHLVKIVIGISIFIAIHLILFSSAFRGGSISADNAAQFGDFVGGYIGTLLLLFTAVFAYRTYKTQRDQTALQLFENRFFELVKIARENSAEVEFDGKKGRGAFVGIKNKIEYIGGKLHACLESELIRTEEKINLAYLITYYGSGVRESEYYKQGQKEIEMNIEPDAIGYFQYTLSFVVAAAQNINEGKGAEPTLGHYMRHLFQTVCYINENELLNYEQKYSYIRTLRAQLSTYEQAVFFYNALSSIGKPWEPKKTDAPDKDLITKYNLVKNIPEHLLLSCQVGEFFPNVHFEGTKKTDKRIELERSYT